MPDEDALAELSVSAAADTEDDASMVVGDEASFRTRLELFSSLRVCAADADAAGAAPLSTLLRALAHQLYGTPDKAWVVQRLAEQAGARSLRSAALACARAFRRRVELFDFDSAGRALEPLVIGDEDAPTLRVGALAQRAALEDALEGALQ